jgi:hypothetical protein
MLAFNSDIIKVYLFYLIMDCGASRAGIHRECACSSSKHEDEQAQ